MQHPKGGRGKQAPYETTHCRIPSAIKPVVEQLSSTYKTLLGSDFDPSCTHLLNEVQSTIAKASYPLSGVEAPLTPSDIESLQKRVEAIEKLVTEWTEKSKDTRDWTKANQLLHELLKFV